ncbi:hypothetical protein [uncultured Bradyrhizobium sp.]|uniref:hypothetical protein n=1 Tax=uncultured Bradyrhizobium sp. TaxID=199684 RepID=UPI0035C9E6DD
MQRRKLVPLIFLLLSSCAAVDQFGERIYDGNKNSQLAQNQETLVNIVRASRLQPLNFVAISQVAGGQTEQLNTGLPTITFGPLQTVAQHQFQVTNSLQSGVSGSYQSSPLVSTAFSTGMLSPIDLRTLAFLVAAYPREPVFFSTIDSIYVTRVGTGETIRLVNDPSSDKESCRSLVNHSQGRLFSSAQECNFALFVNLLGRLSNLGLSAELVKAAKAEKPAQADKGGSPSKGAKSADSSDKSAGTEGRFCFDSTRSFGVTFQPRCGDTKKPAKLTTAFADVGAVELSVILRSPISVFNYYGGLLTTQPALWRDFYFTNQARNLIGEEPFLNIARDASVPCFAKIDYSGEIFCAPVASKHTALLLTLLLHLRNLNIQPSDLNSAFTVRLSG